VLVQQAERDAAGKPGRTETAVEDTKAVVRRSALINGAIAGLRIVSCAPLLSPHNAMPTHANMDDPKKKSGVNSAPTMNTPSKTGNPA
jgi:hypothetical protein